MFFKMVFATALAFMGLQTQIALSQPQSDSAGSKLESLSLEEVLVTSNKIGPQRLQEVPASITVIDQNRIEQAGIDDFLDYVRTVPGLGFQLNTPAGDRDDIRAGRRFALRGIESGYDSVPTTAFYLDETPIPIMDPRLFDIARIEVLRGPQGTLYGANSMGGTIRVVTNQPEINQLRWRGDLSLESTREGDESYGANGMLNVPLVADKVAVRASTFFRNDGGYVDRYLGLPASSGPTSVLRDINGDEVWGARISALVQVSSKFRITPAIFRQEIDVDDSGRYEPDFRDLGRYFMSAGSERQTNDFTLYSVEASYDLTSRLQLVSSSAYFESGFTSRDDVTKGFFDFGGTAYGVAIYPNVIDNDRKSQELRLAYHGARWRGVAGAYYMSEQRLFDQYGTTEATGVWFTYRQANGDEQKALFGEGTFDLTDRWSITGGARWFEGKQDQYTLYTYSLDFPPGDPPSVEEFSGKADASSFSPKLQLRYDFSTDKMAYVSAARGFRPGGPTSLVPNSPECLADLQELGLTQPQTEFGPDKLWNYEIGVKSSFANRRITTNAAVYYVDWKEVQQTATLACGFSFVGNVGAAESKGIELEFWALPLSALSISGSLGYTDAQFTQAAAAVGIAAGDAIPLVPELTGSMTVKYTFRTPTGHTAFVRGDYQYIDKVEQGGFSGFTRPAYGSLDLRLGLGISDHVEVALFVNNVLDERGALAGFITPDDGGIGGAIPAQFLREETVVRPRAIGMTLRYRH
jgi:outer membrane receptor protein involved in Fe transport